MWGLTMNFLNQAKFCPPIQNHHHPWFIFMFWVLTFSHFLSLSGDRRKMKEEKQSPRNIGYKRVRRQSHNFIDCSFCPTLHWTLPFSYKTKPKTLIPMSYVIIIRLQSQKFVVCIVRSISIWACPFTALFILIYPFYQVLVGNTTSFWGGLEIHNTILLWGR